MWHFLVACTGDAEFSRVSSIVGVFRLAVSEGGVLPVGVVDPSYISAGWATNVGIVGVATAPANNSKHAGSVGCGYGNTTGGFAYKVSSRVLVGIQQFTIDRAASPPLVTRGCLQ